MIILLMFLFISSNSWSSQELIKVGNESGSEMILLQQENKQLRDQIRTLLEYLGSPVVAMDFLFHKKATLRTNDPVFGDICFCADEGDTRYIFFQTNNVNTVRFAIKNGSLIQNIMSSNNSSNVLKRFVLISPDSEKGVFARTVQGYEFDFFKDNNVSCETIKLNFNVFNNCLFVRVPDWICNCDTIMQDSHLLLFDDSNDQEDFKMISMYFGVGNDLDIIKNQRSNLFEDGKLRMLLFLAKQKVISCVQNKVEKVFFKINLNGSPLNLSKQEYDTIKNGLYNAVRFVPDVIVKSVLIEEIPL